MSAAASIDHSDMLSSLPNEAAVLSEAELLLEKAAAVGNGEKAKPKEKGSLLARWGGYIKGQGELWIFWAYKVCMGEFGIDWSLRVFLVKS